MKKIIFAGTPEIAAGVLQALVTAHYPIIACLTQPDRPQGRGLKLAHSAVKICSQQNNIPVLQPKSLKAPEIQQQIRELQPDLMIVMAYGLILPAEILTMPKFGCINIHASILPRWRGAAPIQHAILAGDTESGITIMQMDAGLDTGDILDIYPCPVASTDTSATLYDRLALLAQNACLDALLKLQAGSLKATKQIEELSSYAPKIDKHDAKINWANDAVIIDRCIRAYNPWPVSFTTFMDQTVRVWSAEMINTMSSNSKTDPGTILHVDKYGIQVATGNGIINILTMQFPGKKALAVADICHAHKDLKPGAVFS